MKQTWTIHGCRFSSGPPAIITKGETGRKPRYYFHWLGITVRITKSLAEYLSGR